MRPFLLSLLGIALPVFAAQKPAALQVCLTLPAGVQLFAASPQPAMRELGNGVWMLDFDFRVDGHGVERITQSGADCFRAWLPAEKVTQLSFDFSKLPLNLVTLAPRVSVQLKPDLWTDAGRFVIDRAAWSSAVNAAAGVLVLEREGAEMTDFQQLPRGRYVVKFVPTPLPKGDCAATLRFDAVGSVLPERNAAVFNELAEYYSQEVLPWVLRHHQLQCEAAEVVQVTLKVDDGVIRNPLEPRIDRIRVEEREAQFQVTIGGHTVPFVQGMTMLVGAGQNLEFSERSLRVAR